MASRKNQSTIPRSALKSANSRKRISRTSKSVHFHEEVTEYQYDDPYYPTPENPRSLERPLSKAALRRAVSKTYEVPAHGPTPPFLIPHASDRRELEAYTFHLASQLHDLRMADEAATRRREEPYRNVNRAPPRRNTRDEFPEFKKILMGPWVSGVEYGPVLEPQIARKLGSLTLHPVFTRPYKPDKYLDWDILQDVENATMHLPGGRKIPCESFGTQPATAPRVSSLCVVSPDFPWRFQVTSRMWRGYVTIFDVLECLEFAFRGHLHVEELSEKPANDVCDSMETAKAERIARKFGPSYLCQADFLQGKRKIQGFEADLQYAPKGPVDERYVFIQLYIGS